MDYSALHARHRHHRRETYAEDASTSSVVYIQSSVAGAPAYALQSAGPPPPPPAVAMQPPGVQPISTMQPPAGYGYYPVVGPPVAATAAVAGAYPRLVQYVDGWAPQRLVPKVPETRLRGGHWTFEEEQYADTVKGAFLNGMIPHCPEGLTLRTLISGLLNCTAMRISKKYANKRALGKVEYLPCLHEPDEDTIARMRATERAFHASLGDVYCLQCSIFPVDLKNQSLPSISDYFAKPSEHLPHPAQWTYDGYTHLYRKPPPTYDYHAEHAAWKRRRTGGLRFAPAAPQQP